jgi:hypothetical protein
MGNLGNLFFDKVEKYREFRKSGKKKLKAGT